MEVFLRDAKGRRLSWRRGGESAAFRSVMRDGKVKMEMTPSPAAYRMVGAELSKVIELCGLVSELAEEGS